MEIQEFPINPKSYNLLQKVSELVQCFSVETLVQSEGDACDRLNINLVKLVPYQHSQINKEISVYFEQMLKINMCTLKHIYINGREEAGLFAERDYLKDEPILVFGAVTKKFPKISTLSSTADDRVLIGPLRGGNTGPFCNSKYIETTIKQIYCLKATQNISFGEQIIIDYNPGYKKSFWVRFPLP